MDFVVGRRNGVWGQEQRHALYVPDPSDTGEALVQLAARRTTPVDALRIAVLIEAIKCLQGPHSRARQVARLRAEAWMQAGDDEAWWPFSFVAICEALGLSPVAVRETVTQEGFRMPDRAKVKTV